MKIFILSLVFVFASVSGRGIVMCAGGEKYLTNAWVNLHFLRETGCQLPVEIWHIGEEEINEEWVRLFEPLNVSFHDVTEYFDFPIQGWVCKPCALFATQFDEVLLLDADNIPLRDPTFLFEEKKYLEGGALFWPDIMWIKVTNPIWKYLGMPRKPIVGQESGQLVVDKRRHEKPLEMVLELNKDSERVYKWLYGDKDTYLLSWMKLKAPFYMITFFPATVRNQKGRLAAYIQRDVKGQPLFLHLTDNEWCLEGYHFDGKNVQMSMSAYEHTFQNSQEAYFPDGNKCRMKANIKSVPFKTLYPDLESKGLALLDSLREKHNQILNKQ